MLRYNTFVFNPFSENTYVVWDDVSKEAMVVDPGCYSKDEEKEFDEFIETNSLKLKYIVNTHCHLDHIFGNAYIREKYSSEFYAPEKDLSLIDQFVDQAKAFGLEVTPSPKPDKFFDEENSLFLAGHECKPLFTPGHTPGEFCLYFPSNNICFTGDVLFCQSVGRTDLWGGDYVTLISSIKDKLLILPDKVKVMPGHGEESNIGYEREFNSFLT